MNSIHHTQEQLYVTSKIGSVDCDEKILLRHLATSSPLGNIFWRHSRFSPKQPELQTHGDYNHFCPQTANVTFTTLWRTYLPQHIPQCFNLTMHFSLRHLAAKMLSPLHNNFISFPNFFPSYETCSINVNPLFHAAIKNLHIKFNSIFLFLLLHLTPLFPNNTLRGNNQHTHVTTFPH